MPVAGAQHTLRGNVLNLEDSHQIANACASARPNRMIRKPDKASTHSLRAPSRPSRWKLPLAPHQLQSHPAQVSPAIRSSQLPRLPPQYRFSWLYFGRMILARKNRPGKADRTPRVRTPAPAGCVAADPPFCPGRIRLRHLQPLCLALLARQPGSGYDVMAALSALPLFAQARPDAPGVYRTLQAFERRGLIHARRRPSKIGPPRREYTITPAGRACLAGWTKVLLAARGEIDEVIALVQQERKGANRAAGQRSHKSSGAGRVCRSAAPQRDVSTRPPVRGGDS